MKTIKQKIEEALVRRILNREGGGVIFRKDIEDLVK